MMKIFKIIVVVCGLLFLLSLFIVVIGGTLFINSLKFEPMEEIRVIDTASQSTEFLISKEKVRVAAEWESAIGVLVSWPLQIPETLVVEIAEDDKLFVLVADEVKKAEAKHNFLKWGMDLKNVMFIMVDQGDAYEYTRDWGPFAAFGDTSGFRLVDPWFDDYPISGSKCDGRWYSQRKLFLNDFTADDQATAVLANTLNYECTQIPIAFTGGNVMTDGLGTAFSTCAMLNENRKLGVTEDEFFGIVHERLGISRYIIIPNIETLGIQHIDCFLKLLDEETILVARPPKDHSYYEHSENIVRQLSSLTSVYGRPYKIIRIDTPPYWLDFMPAYTNSLILNEKVFVPLYSVPSDKDALDTWRKAMPGYQVIGFEHKGSFFKRWQWYDALHCRTRAIWDPEMLHITHRRLDNIVSPAEQYPIDVKIENYSKAGLNPEAHILSWRLKGHEAWEKVPLTLTKEAGIFSASIPGVHTGKTIEYFLSAADLSGRHEFLPRTAPNVYYSFSVKAQK